MTKVKICGLSTPEAVTTAIEEHADFIGFVFYEPSPRHLEIETAKYLTSQIPDYIQKVGLFVEPDDSYLTQVLNEVSLDMIQLHGKESPERVQEIKEKFSLPVMKAFPIEMAEDIEVSHAYKNNADWFLFDAKGEELPGGNGISFDWNILKDYQSDTPWMLAGGLTAENVAEALSITSPDAVDVSSGVETSTAGEKDVNKIRSFILAAKKA